MSPELLAFKNVLAPTCVIYSGDQHTDAKIKENDPGAQLRLINIRAYTGDWFVFAPEKGRGPSKCMSPLLATGEQYQHHRACDAVVVVQRGAILKLIFIELKSTNPVGYRGQFQSTRQFASYVMGILREFHGITFTVEEKFVLFYTATNKRIFLQKRPTVFTSKSSDDPKNPQKELVKDGVTIYLNQLLK